MADGAVFWGIRTIQERGRGMVPLHAARVQDLGTDDYVIIKCGACGHTAEIPPSGLIRHHYAGMRSRRGTTLASAAWCPAGWCRRSVMSGSGTADIAAVEAHGSRNTLTPRIAGT